MSQFITKFRKLYDSHLQPILVVLILLFGFIVATSFSIFKERPEQLERPEYSPLVQVMRVLNSDIEVIVEGNGTLQARTRINLTPQVGGRVVSLHPSMRAGGYFSAGETLLEVESIDYELAVTQAEANVASAKTRLETERAEAVSARQEWQALQPDEPIPTLVSREPQITEAEAAVKSAEAQLASARLNLQRTKINLPFSGRIVEVNTDIGDILIANQPIGIVYNSEILEVPVPLEPEELAWLHLPAAEENHGSGALVSIKNGLSMIELSGAISRVSSELSTFSRLVEVMVEIDTRSIPVEQQARVIPGQFVDVDITGISLIDIAQIPRTALHDNRWLWTVEDNHIRFVEPEIIRETAETIFVHGLADNTAIVISNLDVVTDGMSVRSIESSEISSGELSSDGANI